MTNPAIDLPPLPSPPATSAVRVWSKSGKFTRGLYEPPSKTEREFWALDGDTEEPLVTAEEALEYARAYGQECARAAVLAERERLRPKTLEERLAALIPKPCERCDGTYQPDTNGYNAFLRCDKCRAVPMMTA